VEKIGVNRAGVPAAFGLNNLKLLQLSQLEVKYQ